jgi:hypothetical protein
MPENARQFVGHGSDRLWSSEPCFPSAEAIAQIILAAPETLRRQAQSHSGPAFDVAGFDGDDFAAGDAIVRAEP